MSNIVLLDKDSHRSLRVDAGVAADLGDNQHFAQVVIGEFPYLAVHYPILLSKDAETGAFYCGAMLGFDEGENLFLAEQAEQAVYRPLSLRRMPFFASGDRLAVDLDSRRIGAAGGQPVFAEDGAPTPYLETVAAIFRELRPGIDQTRLFIEQLLAHKLIEPIEIDVAFDDGGKRNLIGLYTIDQEALRGLSDAVVVDLFRRGYLQLIDLLIASLKQVPLLARRKNRALLDGSGGLATAMG